MKTPQPKKKTREKNRKSEKMIRLKISQLRKDYIKENLRYWVKDSKTFFTKIDKENISYIDK